MFSYKKLVCNSRSRARKWRAYQSFWGFLLVGVVAILVAALLFVPLGVFSTPIKAAAKYKAVLIIGSDVEDLQPGWEAYLNESASYLEQHGVKCYKFYSPNAKWSKIEPVIQGANIVVYCGHGGGYDPDPEPGQVTEPENLNGWLIDQDNSINPPEDPEEVTSINFCKKAFRLSPVLI